MTGTRFIDCGAYHQSEVSQEGEIMGDQKSTRDGVIEFIQINNNTSPCSMDVTMLLGNKLKTDFLLMSEPNLNKARNFQDANCIRDENIDTFIYEDPEPFPIVRLGCRSGFAWVEKEHIIVFSCYVSPSINAEVFQRLLEDVILVAHRSKKPVVLCGDFNTKYAAWGRYVTNSRGELLMNIVIMLYLVCINQRSQPTYLREGSSSVISNRHLH